MGKLINLTDQRFGFWLVIKRSVNNHSGQTCWLCKCECGKEKDITTNSLRSGNSTSCGCNHTPILDGISFGSLKVVELDKTEKTNRRYWKCECVCGNILSLTTNQLRGNHVLSCGCLDKLTLIDDFQKKMIFSINEFVDMLKH